MNNNIKILNTEYANFGSIKNILRKIGKKGILINDFSEIKDNDKIILPGVGNFENIMNILNEKDLVEQLKDRILKKKNKFFCICVGMQILFSGSEESKTSGLSIFPEKLTMIKKTNLRVPHQGWNYLKTKSNLDEKLKKILSHRFYFSHSFWVKNINKELILTETNYGDNFISSILSENIIASQFHPEKSHDQGCQLIRYFCDDF